MENIFTYYKNKRIAVTGASGFIGSYLLNELSKYSKKVYGFSRKKNKKGKLKTLKIDLSSLNDAKKVIKKFDIFFHLGANTNLDKAEKKPNLNYNSNVRPITNLIQAAAFHKKKIKIIFASSASVFGLNNKKKIPEKINPSPINIYDKHKYLVEKILEINSKLKLINSVSLRIQNVYGKSLSMSSDNTRGVLNQMIMNAIKGKPINLFGGGNYYRDFLIISDVVSAIMYAGINDKVNGLTLNIGSNKLLKIKDVCNVIKKEILKSKNKKIQILKTKWPKNHNPIDKRNYILDSSKFRKLTKWKHKIEITNGIKQTINSFNEKLI